MVNISAYRGTSQFGRAYGIMFDNDPHASGSVDRVLLENMIRLCPETVEYLYGEYTPTRTFYRRGTRLELERHMENTIAGCRTKEDRIQAIARFTSRLQQSANQDLDAMVFGGIEEEIIARGSDFCPEVARVGCVLCQVTGLPARMVYLIDTEKAYSGHAIIEVYRNGSWGAVDPLTDVVYRHPMGKPVSTWDLMNDPRLIERHWRGESTPYTMAEQFRAGAVSNYYAWCWEKYDYTVSKINEYYRSILEMSNRGWPGGLRWLHGEDI